MANFGSPDFSGLRQPIPVQMFGPRHSSPNIVGANSPIPPNVGPIPTVPPPGFPGPHMQLFNPIGVPQFPTGAPAMTGLPWGAGVLPIAGQVPVTVPPTHPCFQTGLVPPPVQVQAANQFPPQQHMDQSETQKNLSGDEEKGEHRHRRRHKRDGHRSHREDKHRERKHHKDKKKSPKSSHHHSRDRKKSSRSRHRSSKKHDGKSSKSGHDKRRRHSPSPGEDQQDLEEYEQDRRSERSTHSAVLIEDRGSDFEEGEIEVDKVGIPDDVEDGEIYDDDDDDPNETIYSESQFVEVDSVGWREEERYSREREDRSDRERGIGHRSRDKGKEKRHERCKDDRLDESRESRNRLTDDRGSKYRDDRPDRGRIDRNYSRDARDDRTVYDDYSRRDGRSRQDDEFGRPSRYNEEPGEIDELRYSGNSRHRGTTRQDKYSRNEDEFGYSDNGKIIDRRGSQSERGGGRRGQTGAVLIEDREDRPILRDDRVDRPILRDDRVDRPILRDDRAERPILREDRAERPILREDRAERPILREDRVDRPILREDRVDRPILREDRVDRPILREDRVERPILREDRDDRPILREDRADRPILREDRADRPVLREDRVDRAILKEDRVDRPILREDREGPSRTGAVLLENGEEFDDDRYDTRSNSGLLKDDRRENRGRPLLLDDRDDNRGHPRLKEKRRDYEEPLSKSLDERGDSRVRCSDKGYVERDRNVEKDINMERDKRSYNSGKGIDSREQIDMRNNETFHKGQNKGAKRGEQSGKRLGDVRKEQDVSKKSDSIGRGKGRGKGQASSSFGVQKRKGPAGRGWVPEGTVDAQREDIDKQARDKRSNSTGRTGAVLIDNRDKDNTADKGYRGRGSSFRVQGQRPFSMTDRTNVARRSQERLSGVQNNKRSRSGSQAKQEVRMKKERVSNEKEEPAKKKRRIWEPEPNDVSVTKCIRSGSPVLLDDNDMDPIASWVRCSPADLYFTKDPKTGNMVTTKRMRDLEERFDHELVQRAAMVRALQEPYERVLPKPNWKNQCKGHSHHCGHCGEESDCSSSSSSDSDSESDSEEWWMEEMKFKQQNPYRLHSEIWYNDPNELNYGPLCRCSNKARKFGIRHSIYPGEKPLPLCDLNSNNLDKLYHYRVTVSPAKNFIISQPTVVMFDGHEYLFEGFSIFSHKPIPKWPDCQVIRFNIIYTIHVVEEQVPENFSVQSLDMLTEYLFDEILELVDIDWRGPGGEGNCRRYHVMPRFARPFPENGKELLSMNDVLLYLLKSSKPLLEPSELLSMYELDNENWTKYVDSFRHMVVTCPGKRPSSIRVDQLDRSGCTPGDGELKLPFIIHHGVRPPQLSYAGDPVYKKKWREYMKFRHLLWSRAKVPANERQKLHELEIELEKIRMKCTMKREVTIAVSSEGFLKTGIRADICQHAMILPVLFEHLRFHECLSDLERSIDYQFKDRSLLQLAMTHSSYKINYGTNPDHGRNSLSNCGFRQLEFGDHKVVTQHMRKRGLNILLRIMAKMGHKEEKRSEIPHNERLEFLGDAVVEFVTSTHLYNMFPQASEGDLTLYRGSLVNNAHLSILADKLRLQEFLLYAHGPDLCHDNNLKHAMANCFEALMGALFIDGGIELADRVFSKTCFHEEELLDTWVNTPKHPLIADEPNGDRHWIEQSHVLQKLVQFEEDIGYEFRHIRLLARAFTQRNVGYNNLTYGHNQRLEFLGDTIMQLICTEYLFKHFPDHHEGHLTLLRSSLVNNKTQSTVASELGMPDFVIKANMTKVDERPLNYSDLKTKEKADLLESLYGALYIDGGLEPCQILTDVCFFPRLEDFIADQEWNDPKSQLQQCCLTLREMNDDSPDIPIYKVIRKYGPTNLRKYMVAVYFREKRLAVGVAGSKQQAEMVAAEAALKQSQGLFHKSVFPQKVKNKTVVALKKDVKQEASETKVN